MKMVDHGASLDDALRERVKRYCAEFAGRPAAEVRVSAFWEELVTSHLSLLDRDGFRRFKQTLNFEYSQWCVTAAFDPKLWLMLASCTRKVGVPSLWRQTAYRPGEELPDWPLSMPGAKHVYRLFVSTLWEYARTRDRLGILDKVEESPLGQPIPLMHGSTLLSQDLAISALEINRFAEHCDFDRVERILEIGAGYGRVAYVIRTLLPNVEYHIVDIPPTLAMSQTYLTTLFGEDGLHFHLPGALKDLPSKSFDVVMNISSFDEMDHQQANAYVRAFADKGRGIAYLKGHGTRKERTGRRGILELDYSRDWVELYRGADPFQHTFRELVFRLPG